MLAGPSSRPCSPCRPTAPARPPPRSAPPSRSAYLATASSTSSALSWRIRSLLHASRYHEREPSRAGTPTPRACSTACSSFTESSSTRRGGRRAARGGGARTLSMASRARTRALRVPTIPPCRSRTSSGTQLLDSRLTPPAARGARSYEASPSVTLAAASTTTKKICSPPRAASSMARESASHARSPRARRSVWLHPKRNGTEPPAGASARVSRGASSIPSASTRTHTLRGDGACPRPRSLGGGGCRRKSEMESVTSADSPPSRSPLTRSPRLARSPRPPGLSLPFLARPGLSRAAPPRLSSRMSVSASSARTLTRASATVAPTASTMRRLVAPASSAFASRSPFRLTLACPSVRPRAGSRSTNRTSLAAGAPPSAMPSRSHSREPRSRPTWCTQSIRIAALPPPRSGVCASVSRMAASAPRRQRASTRTLTACGTFG